MTLAIQIFCMAHSLEEIMKRYVITTAQANAPVNKPFWDTLQAYSERNKAELIVLPTSGKSILEEDYDKRVVPYLNDSKNFKINENIRILDAKVRPQSINPLTGIDHFSRDYESSVIFAGTKQVLKYVPDSNDDIPRAMMTTGAVTKPNYNMRHRTGNIAEKDHEYGAVVLDVEDDKVFHHRFIQGLKTNGKISDIEGTYMGKKFWKHSRADAMVLGDIHPFYTNLEHEEISLEQIKHFKPKKLFLHDTFNGVSISHHYHNKAATAFKSAQAYTANLQEELEVTREHIIRYAEAMPKGGKIYLVRSNHDEHLERYLEEARFINDKENSLVGSKLYTALLSGEDPLEVGLNLPGKLPKNVHFLQREDDLKVRGYQLANHGDLGANGGRGSMRSIEQANGKSITGHTHSAAKTRNTYKVGTSTHMRVGYNRGYSGWTNTNGVVYETGQVQLLNTIHGRWR